MVQVLRISGHHSQCKSMGSKSRTRSRCFPDMLSNITNYGGWRLEPNLAPTTPTSLIHSTVGEASTQRGGLYIVLPGGFRSSQAASVINSHSFNTTEILNSQSHNDSSLNWHADYSSPGGDDPHSPSENFEEQISPLSGAPGSSSSASFELPDLSSVPDLQSPSAIPPALVPRSPLPRAFPHLMEALYAELESVARLLAHQPPESRSSDDLNVIMHLIRASTDFRARLQHPVPQESAHGQEISPMHSPTPFSCVCGRAHTPMPTFPRETLRYDPYCNFPLPYYGPQHQSIHMPTPEPYYSPSNVAAPYHAPDPHTLHHESRKHGPQPPHSLGRFKHIRFWRALFRRQVRSTNFVASYGYHDPPAVCAHSWA